MSLEDTQTLGPPVTGMTPKAPFPEVAPLTKNYLSPKSEPAQGVIFFQAGVETSLYNSYSSFFRSKKVAHIRYVEIRSLVNIEIEKCRRWW